MTTADIGPTTWRVLSDTDLPPGPSHLTAGLLVVEFALPLERPTVLLQAEGDNRLALFADPEAGITLTHRRGERVANHRLPGALPALRATARLSFGFESRSGRWRMDLRVIGLPGHDRAAPGVGAMALEIPALQTARRAPALLWYGATEEARLPAHAPWIGPQSLIETPRGLVPAGQLRGGDLVLTLDEGPVALRRLIRRRLPARGSFAPIRLRSPFFGLTRDILVSTDQPILISGPSVEYLCGTEEALVPALALCDGSLAHREERRAVVEGLALDLGRPALILVDGCCMMSHAAPGAEAPRRTLADWETPPLLALLGRVALRHVA
ncbi:Hint domain-containing protein [Rhodobacter sp. KR11]|uniref:Hint domain-containing protein n=1 Tax=Rhodobacter sp. KR11 TaxID=2974588 RepID=UPI002221D742|nr:Hint domain-containing protein [Rhodobacter sp. KR11]MCW1918287.1 Hint domain-containing protein [Rhodobacter sp. KR11]